MSGGGSSYVRENVRIDFSSSQPHQSEDSSPSLAEKRSIGASPAASYLEVQLQQRESPQEC